MIQNILIFINLIGFILSIAWMINSKYDYEPIILTITLLATIVSLIYYKFNGASNKSVIKGNNNRVLQATTNKDKGITHRDNNSLITGDDNGVKQDS